MDVVGLKAWIEELIVRNKSLEKEIETLISTSRNSLTLLEINNQLKQENNQLRQKNIELIQRIESLKSAIRDLMKEAKIIDVSSAYADNEQSNAKMRRRIDCRELVPPKQNNPLMREKVSQGNRKKQKVGEGGSSTVTTVITKPLENPLMTKKFVKTFMAYVAPSDLWACRLVCKMWNVEVTEKIKMGCTFYLNFSYPEKVKRFLEITSTTFSGFRHLKLNITQLNLNLPNQYFSTLFMEHGKYLQSVILKFGSCKGFRMNTFRDLFLPSLQQIKSLSLKEFPCTLLHDPRMFYHRYQVLANLTKIDIVLKSSCYRVHRNTQVLADILRIAPNLKTLQWKETQFVSGHNAYATKMMIESLIQINPPKLETLLLYNQVDPTLVTLLANSHLKLKRLYISELNGFRVDLVAPCTTGRKIHVTPLHESYSKIPGQELKEYLEKKLAKFKHALCIELLKIFLSTLADCGLPN